MTSWFLYPLHLKCLLQVADFHSQDTTITYGLEALNESVWYTSVMGGVQHSLEGRSPYVCFLHTACPTELSHLLLIRTPKRCSALFCSTSIAYLMQGWMPLKCWEEILFMYPYNECIIHMRVPVCQLLGHRAYDLLFIGFHIKVGYHIANGIP